MLLSLNWLKQYLDLPKHIDAKKIAQDLTMSTVEVSRVIDQTKQFNDVIFEIENKSLTNRPDLWSHYGIARELAAIYKTKLKGLELFQQPTTNNQQPTKLDIKIMDKKLCLRYIGCVVNNVKIEKSPAWLVKRLEAVGIRAINNIVDITNYVMMDVGEPTHSFDLALLGQNAEQRGSKNNRGTTRKIIVRKAKKSEKIKTLDGVERKLDEHMLVITDGKKPVALAGIMGGANSEVSEKTTDIILEAATFEPVSVRKTAQKLGLRTEASIRFEKNLDPNFAELGMLRALKLIKEILPGAEISEMVDVDYSSKKKVLIKVAHEFLEKRIGQKIDPKQVTDILERLDFLVKKIRNLPAVVQLDRKSSRVKGAKAGQVYNIEVPSWRATGDVKIPEDIVEEVARIYGYDNLGEKVEMIEMKKAVYQPEFEMEKKIKDYLSLGCGMSEVFNCPWAEEKLLKKLVISDKMIELANPPAEENCFLQTSLIPNLIKNIEDNLRYFDEFKIFELARVFLPASAPSKSHWTTAGKLQDNLPQQPKMLAGAVVVGREKDAFSEAKGIIEKFPIFNPSASSGQVFQFPIKELNLNFIDKDKSLDVIVGKEKIGWLGELKPEIYHSFDFKKRKIGLFEINFDKLVEMQFTASQERKYQPLPQYPSIERDIAIEVDWQVKWGDLSQFILSEAKDPLVKEVCFLSEYDLENKKSLAFRVIYQTDRTLKDEEVEVAEKKIIKMLEKKFVARLRQ